MKLTDLYKDFQKWRKKIIVAKVLPKKSVHDFENVVENSHIWKKNQNHLVGLGGFQLEFVSIGGDINRMSFNEFKCSH